MYRTAPLETKMKTIHLKGDIGLALESKVLSNLKCIYIWLRRQQSSWESTRTRSAEPPTRSHLQAKWTCLVSQYFVSSKLSLVVGNIGNRGLNWWTCSRQSFFIEFNVAMIVCKKKLLMSLLWIERDWWLPWWCFAGVWVSPTRTMIWNNHATAATTIITRLSHFGLQRFDTSPYFFFLSPTLAVYCFLPRSCIVMCYQARQHLVTSLLGDGRTAG